MGAAPVVLSEPEGGGARVVPTPPEPTPTAVSALPDFGLGARIDDARQRVTFRVWSSRATRIEVDVFAAARGEDEKLRVLLSREPDTSVWTADVPLADLRAAGVETIFYGFRAWGPNWPHVDGWTKGSSIGFVTDVGPEGDRFNPNKLLYDPYALELSHDPYSPAPLDGRIYETGPEWRARDTAQVAPKGIVLVGEPALGGVKPSRPLAHDVIYEVHLRGLTMADPTVPAELRGTYAGAARKAAYLRALGVTAIELLPIHETQNEQNDEAPTQQNYWGYATLGYFAPERRFAADKRPGGPTRELRAMVEAFHAEGIKVFADVVYNHTGEGGAALLSWRGLDTTAYYELGDDPHSFANNNGVGPNFNPHHEAARQLVLDSLRYYAGYLGFDGFRFDLASSLGDRCLSDCFVFDKLDPKNVLNRATKELPARSAEGGAGVDLISEPWAIGLGTYQVGHFPWGWAEWNGIYRDHLRTAQNRAGVVDLTPRTVATRLLGSPDLFADDGRGPGASINFLVAHDGFTLRDLYAYGTKQNEQAAPWGPSSGGTDDNISWDHGGDPGAQRRAARTGMLLLASSTGALMILGGDEMYRTQRGNNNAYNLDNAANWLDWSALESEAAFAAFVRGVLQMRASHPALRTTKYFDGKDHDGNGLPDVAILTENGAPANDAFLDASTRRFVAIRRDGAEGGDSARSIYTAYNWSSAAVDIALPAASATTAWYLAAHSELGLAFAAGSEPSSAGTIHLAPRSIVVLVER